MALSVRPRRAIITAHELLAPIRHREFIVPLFASLIGGRGNGWLR
jgi:hypothetical protein